MDAIDGGQARRTKSSSPLGQLFDHGCDGILSGIVPILQAHALGLGVSRELPLLIGLTQILFFAGMWEEKYTGVCRTTIYGLVGTTEFMLGFIIHQFVAGLSLDLARSTRSAVLVITSFGAIVSICSSLYSVWKRTGSITPLVQLLPILISNFAFYHLPRVSKGETFLPFILLGLSNSFLIIQMIIASMSKTEFSLCQWALVPPVALISLSHFGFVVGVDFWLSVVLVCFGAWLVRFLYCITNEIAAGLGIFVFSIQGSDRIIEKSS